MPPLAESFRPAAALLSKDPADQARTIEDLVARIQAQDELIERQVRKIQELEDTRKAGPSPSRALTPSHAADAEGQRILQELKGQAQEQKEQLQSLKEFLDTKYVKQQAIIDKLTEENKQLQTEIYGVKDLTKEAIGKLRAERIVDNKRVNELAETVDNVIDKINEHAGLINKVWQTSKKSPAQPKGEKTLKRIQDLEATLRSGPKTYQEIERILKITPKEMNRLVSKLDMRRFKIALRPGDDRQKVIRLKAWNSLTSNDKYSAEGVGKGL